MREWQEGEGVKVKGVHHVQARLLDMDKGVALEDCITNVAKHELVIGWHRLCNKTGVRRQGATSSKSSNTTNKNQALTPPFFLALSSKSRKYLSIMIHR